MNATTSKLVRCTRSLRCPMCHHDGWCSVREDGSACICMRTESPHPTRNGGWFHILAIRDYVPRPTCLSVPPPPPDLRQLVERAVAATPASWLETLACSLQLPMPSGVDALRRLGAHRARYCTDGILRLSPRSEDDAARLRRQLAWLARADVAGFPMHVGNPVAGIRLRETASGRKSALAGGREGVFCPADLANSPTLFVVEGPTDATAALALGFPALGRPSATGGADAVVDLVRRLRLRAVVLVADRDTDSNQHVGERGADELATRLALLVPDVRVILPPLGAKDLRDAVMRGACVEDFESPARATPPFRITAVRRSP